MSYKVFPPRITFFFLVLISVITSCAVPESTEYSDVQIARDQWGVPHIKGKTDADVAYGLAWAQCEDDFVTMQEQLLAAKGMLGEVKGKDGLIVDFAVKFMGLREQVDRRYESEVNAEQKGLITNYLKAVNNFAALYPDEVLVNDAFPITPQDMLVGNLLGVVAISGSQGHLEKIMNNTIGQDLPTGSNAIAIANSKTIGDKTFLAINSHQPLEGWYSWYEAHLNSEEGLNILGGTFPGGLTIFHGVNENLGWAQTVNHADFTDVYKLEMDPNKKLHYLLDGKSTKLITKKYWSWMKLLGFIKIPIRRTIYESLYGPTFETDDGFFAWRAVAPLNLRMGEQWFAMNKANNYDDFRKALEIQGIPCTNIVYADREDNIFFISNARLPKRDPSYQWDKVLPGNTSKTLWDESDNYSIDEIPHVFNPPSGYLFNTNNSPFNATNSSDDYQQSALNQVQGFQHEDIHNNRSRQFQKLIAQYDSLSYQDFKDVKYSTYYPDTMMTPNVINLELLMNQDPNKYPDIADAIKVLNNWDRNTTLDNTGIALFNFTYKELENVIKPQGKFKRDGVINEDDCVKAITASKKYMIDTYGELEVPWGEIQRHIRGDVNIPLPGGPDVLAAMYSIKADNKQIRGVAGESYIALVQFSKDGVEVETVNAFGSSAEPDSPHYTDQMQLFADQKLKPMSLDIDKAFAEADTVYYPLQLIDKN